MHKNSLETFQRVTSIVVSMFVIRIVVAKLQRLIPARPETSLRMEALGNFCARRVMGGRYEIRITRGKLALAEDHRDQRPLTITANWYQPVGTKRRAIQE